ncbi:MAG: hypothetical protein V1789_01030 [PVC group bacterium]
MTLNHAHTPRPGEFKHFPGRIHSPLHFERGGKARGPDTDFEAAEGRMEYPFYRFQLG